MRKGNRENSSWKKDLGTISNGKTALIVRIHSLNKVVGCGGVRTEKRGGVANRGKEEKDLVKNDNPNVETSRFVKGREVNIGEIVGRFSCDGKEKAEVDFFKKKTKETRKGKWGELHYLLFYKWRARRKSGGRMQAGGISSEIFVHKAERPVGRARD